VEEFNGNRNVVMVSTLASDDRSEEITINGKDGELIAFVSENNHTLDWKTNDIRILISMDSGNREELIKIAESMS
jgi:hypothetical protein